MRGHALSPLDSRWADPEIRDKAQRTTADLDLEKLGERSATRASSRGRIDCLLDQHQHSILDLTILLCYARGSGLQIAEGRSALVCTTSVWDHRITEAGQNNICCRR